MDIINGILEGVIEAIIEAITMAITGIDPSNSTPEPSAQMRPKTLG